MGSKRGKRPIMEPNRAQVQQLRDLTLSHVANKMLHVVFSVLKDNRSYTPILADNNNT